jgi:dipeptidyl aminopeptidase/acylaminoacyl peptidase/tRNA A-37 threonylcarbamoyl transferase component Bud32
MNSDLTDRLQKALEGAYLVDREIGAGGMATVYLARDRKHDRSVAIKVVHPELAAVLGPDRFLREIAITAQLNHPHILPLFDSGRSDGLLYYVMPYVTGESLRARLERERQLSVDEALRITEGVAAALDYAHRHGVVHRDIKPENILLADGAVLVADFGVALAVTNSTDRRMTETGLSLGTPQYMSPEQAMGERTIDGRSDIYSLSCVLYEMLAGEPPFTGPSSQAIVAKILTESPPAVTGQRPATPPSVAETIRRGLQKIPADRFATAGDFAAALRAPAVVRSAASDAANHAANDPARVLAGAFEDKRARHWRTIAIASVVAAVAAIGLAAAAFLARGSGRSSPGFQLARQLTFDGTVAQVAISDDGRWIAYTTRECNTDHSQCAAALQVREVDGTQSVRILSWPSLGDHLLWSPDGATVLFTGSPDSAPMGLYATSRLGGSVRRVTSGDNPIAYAPDGQSLAVAESRGSGQMLVRIDMRTFAPADSVALPSGYRIIGLALSPHQDVIAAVGEPHVKFTTVLLLSRDGKILDSAGLHYDGSEGARALIRWEASGSGVIFFTVRPGIADDLVRLSVRGGRFESHRAQVVLGQVPTGYQGAFDLSRSGRLAVVVDPTINSVSSRPLDGTGTSPGAAWTTLIARTGYLAWPSIAPDGKHIALTATDNLGDNIYLLPARGGTPVALTASGGTREDLHWSPDGHHVSYYDDITGKVGIVSVTDAVEHLSAVSGEFNTWIGNDALIVAHTPTMFVQLDTLNRTVDSVRVADSVAVGSLLEGNSSIGQVAYWSEAAHGIVWVDGHSGRTVAIVRSIQRSDVVGWDGDASVISATTVTTRSNSSSSDGMLGGPNRNIARVSRVGGVTQLGIVAPLSCQAEIAASGFGHLLVCVGAESRPDVWLADAPGKSGW